MIGVEQREVDRVAAPVGAIETDVVGDRRVALQSLMKPSTRLTLTTTQRKSSPRWFRQLPEVRRRTR